MRPDAVGQIAAEARPAPAEQPSARPRNGGGIGAGLDDDVVRLAHHQQRAVRLDRAGEMDLLALAVGQVGLRRKQVRGSTVPDMPPVRWLFARQLSRPLRMVVHPVRGFSLACRLCRLRPSSSAAAVRLPPPRSSASPISRRSTSVGRGRAPIRRSEPFRLLDNAVERRRRQPGRLVRRQPPARRRAAARRMKRSRPSPCAGGRDLHRRLATEFAVERGLEQPDRLRAAARWPAAPTGRPRAATASGPDARPRTAPRRRPAPDRGRPGWRAG